MKALESVLTNVTQSYGRQHYRSIHLLRLAVTKGRWLEVQHRFLINYCICCWIRCLRLDHAILARYSQSQGETH